ncbi:MAG: hypothetical protein [Caudoviricetes sp.]|nr:MAG: hypothetical protein [Caudoviricetes sp.]
MSSDFDIIANGALKHASRRVLEHKLTEGYRYLVRTSDDVLYCWYENGAFVDEQGYSVTAESWRFVSRANISRQQLEEIRNPTETIKVRVGSGIYSKSKYKGD